MSINKVKVRTFLISLAGLMGLFAVVAVAWTIRLNTVIKERLSGKRWTVPSEYFSAPLKIYRGQTGVTKILEETLVRLEYQKALEAGILNPGEYFVLGHDECVAKNSPPETSKCTYLKSKVLGVSKIISFSEEDKVLALSEGPDFSPVESIELEPELLAQFHAGEALMRQVVTLGDVNPLVLNALLAIEDKEFLTHSGISITGIGRAILRNLSRGRAAQGGSTITQQLIKNYFLSSEKTISRKVTEILMALLLESQFTKDDILETYINEVYMGQSGPFQVHGFAMGSKFIFNKNVSDLNLAECALLAGIIQAPNIYNPQHNPDKARARRKVVLTKMLEQQIISQEEFNEAEKAPLPEKRTTVLRDLAPFFIDAVKIQLRQLNLAETEGLKVYTTLNLHAQRAATESVTAGIAQLEKYAFIAKQEQKLKAKLQALLISADVKTGFIEAVVGGRSYSETQLNRTIQSKRQVGSVFKPFVYQTALGQKNEKEEEYGPLTEVLDEPFTHKYQGQKWSPVNYENKYEGLIPFYKGLQMSLNAATAKIALQVGLEQVISTARAMGIESEMEPLPAVSLGTTEFSAYEVLNAYITFARLGELIPLTFISKIANDNNETVWEFRNKTTQVTDKVRTRQTLSIMENVVERGTARGIRALGFNHPAAGKTGTTSDYKDAWFSGFTPYHAAVVWVGFDQPERTGLTGGAGAVPIWTAYMKAYASKFPMDEFEVPEDAIRVFIDPQTNQVAGPHCPDKLPLVFARGKQPAATCNVHQ